MGEGFRRPSKEAHRIPFGFNQRLQIRQQSWIAVDEFLPSSSGQTDAISGLIRLACSHFPHTALNGFEIGTGVSHYLSDAARADPQSFHGQIVAPLAFVEFYFH